MTIPLNGPVLSVKPGNGITVSEPSGHVIVSNNGVIRLFEGKGISLSQSTGEITISTTATGTVTVINAGAGLKGGPITGVGTLSLKETGVTPGLYKFANISVDSFGRVLQAGSGEVVQSINAEYPVKVTEGSRPTISVREASGDHAGIVRITNSVSDASPYIAASALAVKTAFDAAVSAVPRSSLPEKGALIAGSSKGIPTPVPAGKDGQVLTARPETVAGMKWEDQPKGLTGEFNIGGTTVTIENGIITGIV